MQGTQLWSLVWEDSKCLRIAKFLSYNYWGPWALTLMLHNQRSPCNEKPPHHNTESLHAATKTSTAKNKAIFLKRGEMAVPWTVKRVTQIVWESRSCFRRVGSEAVQGHLMDTSRKPWEMWTGVWDWDQSQRNGSSSHLNRNLQGLLYFPKEEKPGGTVRMSLPSEAALQLQERENLPRLDVEVSPSTRKTEYPPWRTEQRARTSGRKSL